MARFTRLKWVPMLLRAYYDAQRQLESNQERLKQTEVNEVGGLDKATESTATTEPVQPSKKAGTPAKRLRPNRVKQRAPIRQAPRVSHKHARLHNVQNARDKYQLLQELQRANQKLEELESIKAQLKELGITIDGFSKEFERLSQHRNTLKQMHDPFMQRPIAQPQHPPTIANTGGQNHQSSHDG